MEHYEILTKEGDGASLLYIKVYWLIQLKACKILLSVIIWEHGQNSMISQKAGTFVN